MTFGLLGKPKKKAKKKPRNDRPARPKASPPVPAKRSVAREEVTSPRLYVGNLDYSANEMQLEELFRGIGQVQSAEVVTNARTQQSKGFAFVEMISLAEAKRAVEVLDDQDFMGRRLIVSGARSEDPSDGDAESGDEETALAETGSDSSR